MPYQKCKTVKDTWCHWPILKSALLDAHKLDEGDIFYTCKDREPKLKYIDWLIQIFT